MPPFMRARTPARSETLDIRYEDARVRIEVNGRQTGDADMQAISGLRDRPRSGYVGLANFLGEANGVCLPS